MLKLWNTRTRKLEEFSPAPPYEVKMYSCGPTVYGPPHIGNLRTYIFSDTVKRALLFNAYTVKHVMNITDVGHLTHDSDTGEEKMDQAAKAEGLDPLVIAKKYSDIFKADLAKLNILAPDIWTPATEHIAEQIGLVKRLLANEFAYETEQAVYFEVDKFPDYGALTGQKLAEKKTAARSEVQSDPAKHHPADFALWLKRAGRFANHILYWPSPWGDGFPGWHIECSAMSMKYLGEQIDIHTGGVDHIMPHHSNEIAQSEAATGKKPFVNFWLHGEFLNIADQRMSKSDGNLMTLDDLADKGIKPLEFRFYVLQTHYRKKISFSWEALAGAADGYRNLCARVRDLGQEARVGCAEFEQQLRDAINDDLNTPQALAILAELLKSDYPNSAKKQSVSVFDQVLGLGLTALDSGPIAIPAHIQTLMAERERSRAAKDFKKADALRRQILQAGFSIEDTDQGPKLRQA